MREISQSEPRVKPMLVQDSYLKWMPAGSPIAATCATQRLSVRETTGSIQRMQHRQQDKHSRLTGKETLCRSSQPYQTPHISRNKMCDTGSLTWYIREYLSNGFTSLDSTASKQISMLNASLSCIWKWVSLIKCMSLTDPIYILLWETLTWKAVLDSGSGRENYFTSSLTTKTG